MVTPLILAGLGALASGALSGGAAAGVEAIVDAAKHNNPPPPIQARGIGAYMQKIKRGRRGTGLHSMKHSKKRSMKGKCRGRGLKGKRGSYWGSNRHKLLGRGSLNIGAYPMITRPFPFKCSSCV